MTTNSRYGIPVASRDRDSGASGHIMTNDTARQRQLMYLRMLTKRDLAERHIRNGGLMRMSEYMKWTVAELVNANLEDDGYEPVSGC